MKYYHRGGLKRILDIKEELRNNIRIKDNMKIQSFRIRIEG